MSRRGATELLGAPETQLGPPVLMGRWQPFNPGSVSGGGAASLTKGRASREELHGPQLLHRSHHNRCSSRHGGRNDSGPGKMEKLSVPHLHQDQSKASVRSIPFISGHSHITNR